MVWEDGLKQFRLSWTIEERCKNSMLHPSQWPCDIEMKNIPATNKINALMESTQQEYSLCLEALKQCGNDEVAAVNLLFDPNDTNKLAQKLPSLEECGKEFHDILGKVSGNPIETHEEKQKEKRYNLIEQHQNVDDEIKIAQLSEMYNIDSDVARFAIENYGYDAATEKLSNEVELQTILAFLESMKENEKNHSSDPNDKML